MRAPMRSDPASCSFELWGCVPCGLCCGDQPGRSGGGQLDKLPIAVQTTRIEDRAPQGNRCGAVEGLADGPFGDQVIVLLCHDDPR